MQYDKLLKAFGEKLGGVELRPDDNGCVVLDADGMPLTIMNLDEVRQVALTGEVGEPPPAEKLERLYRALLIANHNLGGTRGATLSINPETGKVSLCRLISLELTDADSLFAEVENFVNVLGTWRTLVSDFRGAELEQEGGLKMKADDANSSLSRMGGIMSGFLRV